MRLIPYNIDELSFAFSYHVYFRWRTHYLRRYEELAGMTYDDVENVCLRFNIHLLSAEFSETDACLLVSLDPRESVSVCASKLKGQLSKLLREAIGNAAPSTLFGRGYFACTSGRSDKRKVEEYLSAQSEHHGYALRARRPAHVETFAISPADERRLSSAHARTILDFHVVLATWRRKGVFGAFEGRAATNCWRSLGLASDFALRKVSFVPDHVHVAVRLHPRRSPASLVVDLMNRAQEALVARAGEAVVRAGVERVWQPSAYIGSFGDLTTGKIQRYLRKWSEEQHEGT